MTEFDEVAVRILDAHPQWPKIEKIHIALVVAYLEMPYESTAVQGAVAEALLNQSKRRKS